MDISPGDEQAAIRVADLLVGTRGIWLNGLDRDTVRRATVPRGWDGYPVWR